MRARRERARTCRRMIVRHRRLRDRARSTEAEAKRELARITDVQAAARGLRQLPGLDRATRSSSSACRSRTTRSRTAGCARAWSARRSRSPSAIARVRGGGRRSAAAAVQPAARGDGAVRAAGDRAVPAIYRRTACIRRPFGRSVIRGSSGHAPCFAPVEVRRYSYGRAQTRRLQSHLSRGRISIACWRSRRTSRTSASGCAASRC